MVSFVRAFFGSERESYVRAVRVAVVSSVDESVVCAVGVSI